MTKTAFDDLPEFGDFRIDIHAGILYRGGKVVPLRPKAFTVLSALHQHINEILEYAQIGQLGWSLPHVEKHNVQTTMQEVIQALGDRHGVRIENFPTRGYRLVTDEHLAVEAQARTNVGSGVFEPGLQQPPEFASTTAAGAAVIFDGVTLNKASELLYDTEATLSEREASGTTYVRSLEDFTMGFVFGGCVFSGKVQEVAPGVEPVSDMRKEFGEERIQQFKGNVTSKPSDLLDPHHDERTTLEALLLQLGDAIVRNPDSWREHAIREIRGIGPGVGLSLFEEDPGKYSFATDFWRDRLLQDTVPQTFIEFMVKVAKGRPELPASVHDAALREYFSRNALAHILVFRWYQEVAERQFGLGGAVFIPHATRASLIPTRLLASIKASTAQSSSPIWRLKRFAMPRIILSILDQSIGRDDFRKILLDHAHRKLYREHRELFATIVASLAENRLKEADRAAAALIRLCSSGVRDDVRCCQLSARADGGMTLPFATRQNPVMPEYFAALERVFPELKLTKISRR
jgi:DNA-binding winged helix-turn-helix (wHTH) protein